MPIPIRTTRNEEVMILIVNKRATEANIRTVKTTEELQGTLFDMMG
jgi:hypothetical protein